MGETYCAYASALLLRCVALRRLRSSASRIFRTRIPGVGLLMPLKSHPMRRRMSNSRKSGWRWQPLGVDFATTDASHEFLCTSVVGGCVKIKATRDCLACEKRRALKPQEVKVAAPIEPQLEQQAPSNLLSNSRLRASEPGAENRTAAGVCVFRLKRHSPAKFVIDTVWILTTIIAPSIMSSQTTVFGACKNPACTAGCNHYVAAPDGGPNIFLVPCLICALNSCKAAQHEVFISVTPSAPADAARASSDASETPKVPASESSGNPLTGSTGGAGAFRQAARDFSQFSKLQAASAPVASMPSNTSQSRFDPVDRAQKKVDLDSLGVQHLKRKKKRAADEKAQLSTVRPGKPMQPKTKLYTFIFTPRTKAVAAGLCSKPNASETGQLFDAGLVQKVDIPVDLTDPIAFRDAVLAAFQGTADAYELAQTYGVRLLVSKTSQLRRRDGSVVPKPRGRPFLRPLSSDFTAANVSRAQVQSTVRGAGYRQPIFIALNPVGPNVPLKLSNGSVYVSCEFESTNKDVASEIEEESESDVAEAEADEADDEDEDEPQEDSHGATGVPLSAPLASEDAPTVPQGTSPAFEQSCEDGAVHNDIKMDSERRQAAAAKRDYHEDDEKYEKIGENFELSEARHLRDAMYAPNAKVSNTTDYWAVSPTMEVQRIQRDLESLTADLIVFRERPDFALSNRQMLYAMDDKLIKPLDALRDVLISIMYNKTPTTSADAWMFKSLFKIGPGGLVDPLLRALEQCFFIMPRMHRLDGVDRILADNTYQTLSKYTAGVLAGIQLLRSSYPRHIWDPPNGIRELATIIAHHRAELQSSPYLDWEQHWGFKKLEERLKKGGLITVAELGIWFSDGLNALNDTDPRRFDFDRSVTSGDWGAEGIYLKLVCRFQDQYDTALPGYAEVFAKVGRFCYGMARKIRNHLRAPDRVLPQHRASRLQSMNKKTGQWRSDDASASKAKDIFEDDTPDDMTSTDALDSDWFEEFDTAKDAPLPPLKKRRQARRRHTRSSPVIVSSDSDDVRPPPKKPRMQTPPRANQSKARTGSGPRRSGPTASVKPKPRPIRTEPPARAPTRMYAGEEELLRASGLASLMGWRALLITILWDFAHPCEDRRPVWSEFLLLSQRQQYRQLSLIYHEDKNVTFGRHWRQVTARVMAGLNAYNSRNN
ncbi:hypothetical protein BD626DRAFT_586764 [Schizophyllum amplum]|uniref:Uncharacterized protein n=1 Tax=Schizophyllum amplum TaxID=97359 RepID=A0A550BXH3_9AGAR|nr:hypothetical protein BD626DRAFT_586764 [Auriculariopsis ampla]